MKYYKSLVKCTLIAIFVFILGPLVGQEISVPTFGKGVQFHAADSSFHMKFGARFQTLYEGRLNLENDQWNDVLLIRRFRLKFDGYAFNPKFTYKIELALSNRDTRAGQIDPASNTASIVLDAVLKWKFANNWELWFGQTKLPGNRERVISSQKLQFVDRSLVNSRFTLDRDVGFQLRHKNKLGNGIVKQIFSISSGEGRNLTSANVGGYDYTGRLEFLPMGDFNGGGDYFGSDLKREETPKLAIGLTYDFNDGAGKQRGQLGGFVIDSLGTQHTNDLTTVFVDAMFKYKGFSIMSEYANKSAADNMIAPTETGSLKFGTGEGLVFQMGYLFPGNFEIAGRYTTVTPDNINFSGLTEETEYSLGLSRYIVGHNLKVQSDFSITERPTKNDEFRFRFQVEMAF